MNSFHSFSGRIFRLLPYFTGKFRIVRFLLGNRISELKDFRIKGKFNSVYLLPNLIESIGFELYANGVFEKELIDFILERLPENGVFIDLGANIGSHSIPVCKMKPAARVFSVEASPFVLPYLKKNIQLNDIRNIVLYEAAVSDRDESKVDFFYPESQFGKGSVTNLFNSESVSVTSVTLDRIVRENNLENVDIVKVDIEGSEILAFRGADELLSRKNAPSIIFEFLDYAESAMSGINRGEAQQFLLDKGYFLYEFKDGKLKKMVEPIREGYALIWATKKQESLKQW